MMDKKEVIRLLKRLKHLRVKSFSFDNLSVEFFEDELKKPTVNSIEHIAPVKKQVDSGLPSYVMEIMGEDFKP